MQPIALEDIEADGKLEEGFQEDSMVSAMPNAQDFEKDYQTCPDCAKIFHSVEGRDAGFGASAISGVLHQSRKTTDFQG